MRSPAWTPDGRYVLARKEDGKRAGIPPVELWMYHREGGGAGIKLTSGDDCQQRRRRRRLARRHARSTSRRACASFNYTPDLSDGLWQIWRYDRDLARDLPGGRRLRRRRAPRALARRKDADLRRRGATTRPCSSPGTSRSGSERILARGVTRDEMEGFAQMDLWPGYAFTPDGKSLVFSNHGKLARLDVATGEPSARSRSRPRWSSGPRPAWPGRKRWTRGP